MVTKEKWIFPNQVISGCWSFFWLWQDVICCKEGAVPKTSMRLFCSLAHCRLHFPWKLVTCYFCLQTNWQTAGKMATCRWCFPCKWSLQEHLKKFRYGTINVFTTEPATPSNRLLNGRGPHAVRVLRQKPSCNCFGCWQWLNCSETWRNVTQNKTECSPSK